MVLIKYDKFKGEFGDINHFKTIGELIEEIYSQIYYYNHDRLHTSIDTSPYQFRVNYYQTLNTLIEKRGT